MSGIVLEHSGYNLVESYEKVVNSVFSPTNNDNEVILEPAFYKKFELKPAFTIVRLRENSPALLAGLQVGDEVLKVNNRSAWKMDLDDFTRLFTSEEGKNIDLEVSRKGSRQKFQFQLRNPLQ
jgi:S1-C subfamily serine protease